MIKCSETDGGEGYTSANVLQTTELYPLHRWIARYVNYVSIKRFKKDCENVVLYLPDGTYAFYTFKKQRICTSHTNALDDPHFTVKTEATPALSSPEVTEQVCPEPGSPPFCGWALRLPASFCESGRRDRPPSPPPASIKSLVHSFKINNFLNLHYARLSISLLTGLPAPHPAPSLVFTGIWLEPSQLQSLLAQSPNPVPISLTAEAKSSLLPSRPHKTGHCSFCPQPHPLPFAPSQQSSNTSGLALPPGLCTGGSLCLTLFPKRPRRLPPPLSSLYSNVTSKGTGPTPAP